MAALFWAMVLESEDKLRKTSALVKFKFWKRKRQTNINTSDNLRYENRVITQCGSRWLSQQIGGGQEGDISAEIIPWWKKVNKNKWCHNNKKT